MVEGQNSLFRRQYKIRQENELPRCKHSSVHWTLASLRERGIRVASLYGSLSNKLS